MPAYLVLEQILPNIGECVRNMRGNKDLWEGMVDEYDQKLMTERIKGIGLNNVEESDEEEESESI